MNVVDVVSARTPELVAFHNLNAPKRKHLPKSTDRKTAEARVARLVHDKAHSVTTGLNEALKHAGDALEALQSALEVAKDFEENIAGSRGRGRPYKAKPVASDGYGVLESVRVDSHSRHAANDPMADGTFIGDVKPRKAHAMFVDRRGSAKGISASWSDPRVRRARMNRQAVMAGVGSKLERYRSVREAFEMLGLPLSKHIRFRLQLKSLGELAFAFKGKTYNFQIAAAQ